MTQDPFDRLRTAVANFHAALEQAEHAGLVAVARDHTGIVTVSLTPDGARLAEEGKAP